MAEDMRTAKWLVGVVVPACNEESTIESCIDSTLAALDTSSQVGSRATKRSAELSWRAT
jgi:hypothetical protein